MFNKINFEENNDGTYNLLIHYSGSGDTEFGLEFLYSEKLKHNVNNVLEYLKDASGKMKIRAIKILVNGAIITTISLSSFMSIYGATRYSMAYLSPGTATQQMSYMDRTNGAINTVSPSYFNITGDGSLSISTMNTTLINHAHSIGLKVIPYLSNHWDRTAGIAALNNAEALSTQIANYISQYNLDGINVDIENVTETERDLYASFVAKLRAKIPTSKEVSIAVAANPKGWVVGWHGSYDYTNLAKNSNYLMMMTYDEHWQGSDPGPVASISFVENSIKYALTKTTADKIVMGLPFYGRIWSADNSFNGNGITLDRVNTIILTYHATITYDNTQQSSKAVFTIKSTDTVDTLNGKTLTPGTYTIWYESEASIRAKMALINKYNLKGVGAWALGQEPSTIWKSYSSWLNPTLVSTPKPTPVKVTTKTGTVTTAVLNVRSGPSTRSRIISTVRKNSTVTILATKSGWHTVKLANGKTGYVSASYVREKTTTPTKSAPAKSTTRRGVVRTAVLNVRSSPSTRSKIVTTLRRNSSVTITATRNGWHTIRLANGRTGYVSSSLVTIK